MPCDNIGTTKKINKATLAEHFTSNFIVQFVYQETF